MKVLLNFRRARAESLWQLLHIDPETEHPECHQPVERWVEHFTLVLGRCHIVVKLQNYEAEQKAESRHDVIGAAAPSALYVDTFFSLNRIESHHGVEDCQSHDDENG